MVQMNLIRGFMSARTPHEALQPGSTDVADLLGITEYFDEKSATKLLTKAYELVRPGGVMIFGNMLDTHPTLLFNQRIVEWPGVIVRSLDDLVSIAETVAADGVAPKIYIPDDKIYGVVEIAKPAAPSSKSESAKHIGSTALATQ